MYTELPVRLFVGIVSLGLLPVCGQTPAPIPNQEREEASWMNTTMGGMQFWTDVRYDHGWRIQRNAVTGHYRLLDDRDVRQAWGTKEDCLARLAEAKRNRKFPQAPQPCVILLHGLARSRDSMAGLARFLRTEGDYLVCNVGYASTRANLDHHAAALEEIIAGLDGVTQIDLVGHSLGNIVIRRYLKRTTDPLTGRQGDARIRRMVMLGPPNQGAQLARRLHRLKLFETILGPSAMALADKPDELGRILAVPRVEFGIIAGRGGFAGWQNPLITGDGDFIVGVEETQLPGAKDVLVVQATHAFLMDQPKVQQATLQFLKTGRFEADP